MSNNTPPPYVGITGIYTVDDKHQAISKAQYDGSAKPGQIVIDTSNYSVWVGNANGNLNAVGGGGGGTPAGATNEIQYNNAGSFDAVANIKVSGTTLQADAFTSKVGTATAGALNCATGDFFSITVTGATTLSATNVPAAGRLCSIMTQLTNGGTNVSYGLGTLLWASGTAPTLTVAGTDVLGFYTVDGGTTWVGLVLALDVKV